MLRPFLVLGFLSAATGACADPVPLTADDLKGLAGSLVEIDTPLGTKLPIRFGKDGLVSAEAGELAPLLGSAKDRGRWWVDGDKLCSKWFRWFDAKPRCITVAQDGTRLHWRQDDGDTGTATLVEAPAPKEEPAAKRETIIVADAAPAAKPAIKKAAPKTPEAVAQPKPDIAVVHPAPAAEAPQSPPVVVAQAEPDVAKPPLDETGMMRFGGAELLEASARVGGETPSGVETAALAPASVAPSDPANVDDALSPLRREARTAAKPVPPAASTARPPVAKVPRAAPLPVAKAEAGAAAAPNARMAQPATAESKHAPLYRVYGVHRSDVLNVRRGPAETHPAIASIPSTGRRIAITGRCEKDWCPIRYGRVRGWVNSFYLVAEGGGGASSQSQVYLARP